MRQPLRTPTGTTRVLDMFSLYRDFRPHVQRQAIEARLEGYHYGGFQVGAAGYGITPAGPRIFWGSNYKSKKGTEGPRVCAEDEMEKHALMRGCTHLVGFAVAAFPKIDDASGRDLNGCTIPCETCRRMFAASMHEGGIFKPTTVCELMRLGTQDDEVIVERVERITIRELLQDFPVPDP